MGSGKLEVDRWVHGKGSAPSTTSQKATSAVIDDACTVFDDGGGLLFGELSSLSLTTRAIDDANILLLVGGF